MAQATTILFGDQAILIGNGATPEVFTAPCGLTELTRTINTETSTTNVPDCIDPDLPSWLEIDAVSKQMVLSGNGVLAVEYLEQWRLFSESDDYRTVRWYRDLSAANGGGYYEGPALLTTYEESGARGRKWNVSIGLTFDGKPIWHAA